MGNSLACIYVLNNKLYQSIAINKYAEVFRIALLPRFPVASFEDAMLTVFIPEFKSSDFCSENIKERVKETLKETVQLFSNLNDVRANEDDGNFFHSI